MRDFYNEFKYASFKSTIPSFNLRNKSNFLLFFSFRTLENQENQKNQTSNFSAEKGKASRQQCLFVDGGKNKIKEVDQIISNVAAFIENNDVRKQTFWPRDLKRWKEKKNIFWVLSQRRRYVFTSGGRGWGRGPALQCIITACLFFIFFSFLNPQFRGGG